MSEKRYRVTIEEYDNGGWRLRGCTTAGEDDVAGILLGGAKGAMDTSTYALIMDARERLRKARERGIAKAAAKKQAAGKPTTTH